MSERCEKCGGTDILVRYFAKGQMLDRHQKASDARWKDLPDNVGEDVYRLTATEPLLRKRCRTCQWWWTEEPGAAPEPTAEPEGEINEIRTSLLTEADTLEDIANEADGLSVDLGIDGLHYLIDTLRCGADALATRPPSEALREARELIEELAQDVEAEVLANYCDAGTGELLHESYRRKLDRDMDAVYRARRWLARTDATE